MLSQLKYDCFQLCAIGMGMVMSTYQVRTFMQHSEKQSNKENAAYRTILNTSLVSSAASYINLSDRIDQLSNDDITIKKSLYNYDSQSNGQHNCNSLSMPLSKLLDSRQTADLSFQ